MTPSEFDRWWEVHTGLFPGFGAWVRPFPACPVEWYGAIFSELPLADCIKASRELFASGNEVTFGRHGIEIRSRAQQMERDRQREAEIKDRNPCDFTSPIICKLCRDTLYIMCRDRYAPQKPALAYRCTQCVRGRQLSAREHSEEAMKKRLPATVYDPDRLFVDPDWPSEWADKSKDEKQHKMTAEEVMAAAERHPND